MHSGIGNLRGWAISTQGTIAQVQWALDGQNQGIVPYGGSRDDVANAFPNIANANASGFSMAFGYANLSTGPHTITVTAIDDQGGRKSATNTLFVLRIGELQFIAEPSMVRTDAITIADPSGQQIQLNGLEIEDTFYNVTLEWRTATQGFELISVREQ